ncbi:MAG: PAS domain S-box protein [Cyanobacteria bacterium P01_G01_bin.54]
MVQSLDVYSTELTSTLQTPLKTTALSHTMDNERFFQLSVDMLCIADLKGYFKRVNPAFERTLGYTTQTLLTEPFLTFVHPDDQAKTLSELDKLAAGAETIAFENRYRCRDGAYKWLMWTAHPDLTQQVVYASARDISDRKRTEHTLREQAALLDIATNAIMVCDLDHQITYWNDGAASLYGWTHHEILNQPIKERLFKYSGTDFAAIQDSLSKTGQWQGELRQITKMGQAVIVESRWKVVLDEIGQPKSTLVVNTDITEKKQLEAQFLRTQRLESLGTLASGLAHDLGNLLTSIMGGAQLLPQVLPPMDESAQRLVDLIETNSLRGINLIKQVLLFAQGAQGPRANLSITPLIAELSQMVNETFPKNIELRTHVAPELWQIKGNPTQLYQVLLNLFINARDAMLPGGTLSLDATNIEIGPEIDATGYRSPPDTQMGKYILVSVTDTGSGISPDVIDKIFEPFFTTKAPGRGTGLGLSTSIGIIKSHGGFVEVHSEIGQGTEFKIYLPAV